MAAALVDVPVISMFRTGFAPMVWPITAPKASITRHMLAPSVPIAALVAVPKITLQRYLNEVVVSGISSATATATITVSLLPRRFNITKSEVSVSG